MSEVITIDDDDCDLMSHASTSAAADAAEAFAAASTLWGPVLPPPSMAPSPGRMRGVANRMRGGAGGRVNGQTGVIQPFGVFSQERRAALHRAHPECSEADVSRKLGELWHALTEPEKQFYRERAKRMQAKRDAAAARAQAASMPAMSMSLPPPMLPAASAGRLMSMGMATGLRTAAGRPRARRVHGYALFNSEMRRKLAGEGLSMTAVSTRVAEEWRNAAPEAKRLYESKAAKINQEEDMRLRQHLIEQQRMQQQQQQLIQQQQQRIQQQQQRLQQQQHHHQQQFQQQQGQGLRIASISTLSGTNHSNRPLAAPPNVQLPSGITISRVEPEISIVSEQYSSTSNKLRVQLPPSTQLTVQRSQMRHSAMSALPALPALPTQTVPPPPPMIMRGGGRGRRRGGRPPMTSYMMHNGHLMNGGGRQLVAPPLPLPPGLSAKRSLDLVADPVATKRPRVNYPPLGDILNLGTPVAPTAIAPNDRMCRLCAAELPRSGAAYTLRDRPELVLKVERALSVKLDLDSDSEQGFPGVVCRKCCHAVITFLDFAKSVDSGMVKVGGIVAERNKARLAASDLIIVPAIDDVASQARAEASVTSDVDIKHEPVEVKSQLKIKKAEEINNAVNANATSGTNSPVDTNSANNQVTKPSVSESEQSVESVENLIELEDLHEDEAEKPEESHEHVIDDEDGVESELSPHDFDPLTFEEPNKDECLQDEDDEDVFDEELETVEAGDPTAGAEGPRKESGVSNSDNMIDGNNANILNDVASDNNLSDVLMEPSQNAKSMATSGDKELTTDFAGTSEANLTPAAADSHLQVSPNYNTVMAESNASYTAEVSSTSLAKSYFPEAGGNDYRPMADFSASSSAMSSSAGYPMAGDGYYDPSAANFDASGFSQQTDGYDQYGMHGQAYYSTAESAADKPMDPAGLNGEAHFLMDASQQ